jgi:putative DNA primase/helicase
MRDGKPTKSPYRIDAPSRGARSNDPATWGSFDDACAALADPRLGLKGIGFVFSADDPYAGIDFDHCLDADGRLLDWASPRLERLLPTYAEVSPSGRGVKLFVRGRVPEGRGGTKKGGFGPDGKGAIEVYDRGRYFTTTGRAFSRSSPSIAERSAQLLELYAELKPPKAETAPRPERAPTNLPDRELLERIFRSKNGREVEALFNGLSNRHPSGSEADLALCSHLAFWTGGDVHAIDRLFRQSALFDRKWEDRADYREMTINRSLERSAFYDPDHRTPKNGVATRIGSHATPPPVNGHLAVAEAEAPREADDDPHRLARTYLDRRCRHADGHTLRFWLEEWHRWDGRSWTTCAEKEVTAGLTGAIKAEFDRLGATNSGFVRPVTTRVVGNAMQALRDVALLSTRDCPRQPAWLGPFEPGEDLPDPFEVLPAANGLVHLPSFVAGVPCLLGLTPRFFSPNSLGYDFLPHCPEPSGWLAFLKDLWPHDTQSVACLQEWFGYLLTPDTSQQKILMLIGPRRSGKGTIGRVLRAVVGPSNVEAPTLSSLSNPFGLQPLIGKTVGLISDARLSGRADAQTIIERMLSISGEDAQTIDRKHLTSWSGSLPTRFVVISNELPRLGDASVALPGRMILLRLTESFFGKEDTKLSDNLMAERPAILRWAVAGWARLRERGRFLQPDTGKELLQDLEELSSPVGAFVAECCTTGPACSIPIRDLFEAWRNYCRAKGRDHVGDEQGFGRNLRAVIPGLNVIRPTENGERVRKYEGIELKF